MSVQIDGSTGNIIATKADYSGNVSIGGTLTYEDVTNVDSVGVITARSGIRIGATGANTLISGTATGIGIGENSPDGLLVIKGDSNGATNPSIRLKDGSDTREAWITNSAGDLILANGGDDNVPHCVLKMFDGNIMVFSTANTERLRIASDGKILAGHTADISGGGLQVSGSANAGNAGFHRFDANDSGPFIQLLKSRNGTVGSNTVVQSGDELGTLNFQGADGTDFHSGARIVSKVDGTPGNNDMPGRLEFHTTSDGASSPTERVRITSAGLVGIGENNPDSRLHVKGGSLTVEHSSPSTGTCQLNINCENNSQVSVSFDDQGHISFGSAATPHNQGSFSEKVRIQNGGGISFNGDAAQANALDDYEEGNGTPTVSFETSGTATLAAGATYKYVKIGDLVTFSFEFNLSSVSSPSGGLRLNLPFASGAGVYSAGAVRLYNVTFTGSPFLQIGPSSSYVVVLGSVSGSANSKINGTGYYFGSISYRTSS